MNLLYRLINSKSLRLKTIILMIADVIALITALIISFLLRYDTQTIGQIYTEHIEKHLVSLPIIFITYIIIFHICQLYKYIWRFASLEILWAIVAANTIGIGAIIFIQTAISQSIFPGSVLAIFWMLSVIFIGASRIILRMLSTNALTSLSRKNILANELPIKRVIILGAGMLGARVLRGIHDDPALNYEVIGFLDDNPDIKGTIINNVEVLGPLDMLEDLLNKKMIDEVIIAISSAQGSSIRKYVLECRKRRIPVKIVPYLKETLNSKDKLNLEDISVEDLLRRPPVKIDLMEISEYIHGKRVLVTGAGGSIGSELCRQICRMQPGSLVLLGHGENSIYKIHQELRKNYPELSDRLHEVIASISNESRINQAFNRYNPQVVFHAAAHKHVPIMEKNLQEAVFNNVVGTANIAQACGRHRVKKMVMISTDKAANPASVMGGTKWLCEQVVLSATREWKDTAYITVRFGNVLGSRGSVVPLFQEQIRKGGPITVTHPEMTRYFMTIPEAAQLVMLSGSVGRSGDLYLLDMGEPVKIVDLAKDMIRLSGLEPDIDIAITYTGIRPGEKLHEILATEECEVKETEYEKLSIVYRKNFEFVDRVGEMLERAKEISRIGSEEDIEEFLSYYIPGFLESHNHSLENNGIS